LNEALEYFFCRRVNHFRIDVILVVKNWMKKNILIASFVFLVSFDSMAQKQDSASAKSLIEKGTLGDIILGKENKKSQLSATPPMLKASDSSQKKDSQPKKKKTRSAE